jgi:hypothetical protein
MPDGIAIVGLFLLLLAILMFPVIKPATGHGSHVCKERVVGNSASKPG